MFTNFTGRVLRSLPNFRGKFRLARALLRNSLALRREISLLDRQSNRFTIPNAIEPIGFSMFVNGAYEESVMALIRSSLHSAGCVFVDVGANIGCFSIPVGKQLASSGTVFAIEASPWIFRYLKANVMDNGLRNVHCVHAAAASESGSARFFEAPSDKFGMGSLGGFGGETGCEIPAAALDDLAEEYKIGRIDVLKVDVEGFERGVFEGAARLLNQKRIQVIVFEFLDWAECRKADQCAGDAQQFLLDCGYALWRLRDFGSGKPRLQRPVTEGGEMLVAVAQEA